MDLFSPLTLRGVTFRNRIGISPMCQYSAQDGFANDWHLVHLGSRAVGGAGLVIVEATGVEARGRISPADLGLWKDEQIAPLTRIAAFLTAQGAVPGIQLAHAGRKASTRVPWVGSGAVPISEGGWEPVGPTSEPFSRHYPVPRAATEQDLDEVVQAFTKAAQRALEAGFRVLEIHAAHGYLLHSFLSPLANHRPDRYGGSLENRARLLTRVVQAVRALDAHAVLSVRVSATDWHPGGWTGEDSVALARTLQPLGVDLLDCSSGGIAPGISIPVAPLYQVPYAAKVKAETGLATAAVGLITTPEQAQSILAEGKADLVLLARESLRDPYFALRAAQARHSPQADALWPPQYARAKPS